MTITAKHPGRCTACKGAIKVGDEIDWTRGKGSAHVTCPANPEPVAERPQGVTTDVPVPTDATRPGRMLLAGEVNVTMTVAGEHATFYLRSLIPPAQSAKGEWERTDYMHADRVVLVSAAKRGQRIGKIDGNQMTFRSDVTETTRQAFNVLVLALAGELPTREVLPSEDAEQHGVHVNGHGFQAANTIAFIQALSYCGRCGKELKRPESIDLGLGPECSGKGSAQYGSRSKGHVTVREANEHAAVAAATERGDDHQVRAYVGDDGAAAERRMQEMEAQGDREQTIRDEQRKHEARAAMEDRVPLAQDGTRTPVQPAHEVLTQVRKQRLALGVIADADAATLDALEQALRARRAEL